MISRPCKRSHILYDNDQPFKQLKDTAHSQAHAACSSPWGQGGLWGGSWCHHQTHPEPWWGGWVWWSLQMSLRVLAKAALDARAHLRTPACACIHMYACVHACKFMRVHAYTHACMHSHIHVCVHTCARTHVHTRTLSTKLPRNPFGKDGAGEKLHPPLPPIKYCFSNSRSGDYYHVFSSFLTYICQDRRWEYFWPVP